MSNFPILNYPCTFKIYYYLVFFYLSKLLFSGFLQFKWNFVRCQKNQKLSSWVFLKWHWTGDANPSVWRLWHSDMSQLHACNVPSSKITSFQLKDWDRSIQQVPVKRQKPLRIQWIRFIINNKIALRAHNENLVLTFHIKTRFKLQDFYKRKTRVNRKLIWFWVKCGWIFVYITWGVSWRRKEISIISLVSQFWLKLCGFA